MSTIKPTLDKLKELMDEVLFTTIPLSDDPRVKYEPREVAKIFDERLDVVRKHIEFLERMYAQGVTRRLDLQEENKALKEKIKKLEEGCEDKPKLLCEKCVEGIKDGVWFMAVEDHDRLISYKKEEVSRLQKHLTVEQADLAATRCDWREESKRKNAEIADLRSKLEKKIKELVEGRVDILCTGGMYDHI